MGARKTGLRKEVKADIFQEIGLFSFFVARRQPQI